MTRLAGRNNPNTNLPSSSQYNRKTGGYDGKGPRAKIWGGAGKEGAKGKAKSRAKSSAGLAKAGKSSEVTHSILDIRVALEHAMSTTIALDTTEKLDNPGTLGFISLPQSKPGTGQGTMARAHRAPSGSSKGLRLGNAITLPRSQRLKCM